MELYSGRIAESEAANEDVNDENVIEALCELAKVFGCVLFLWKRRDARCDASMERAGEYVLGQLSDENDNLSTTVTLNECDRSDS